MNDIPIRASYDVVIVGGAMYGASVSWFLSDNPVFADMLRESQQIQAACGAGTRFMTADEIKHDYPFFNLDDIIGANHNLIDEGYFDGGSLFDW